jgi:hypothetical protein
MATPKHYKLLLLGNHIRMIAFISYLQRLFFYSIIEFLYYNSTAELESSLILMKGSYPSSKAILIYRRSLSVL